MEKFLDNLARLGYPLFSPEESLDVNQTLAEAVKSDLVRVWEGFPVLLVNAVTYPGFNYKKVVELLKTSDRKEKFNELVLVSLGLYKFLRVHYSGVKKVEKELPEKNLKTVSQYRNYFAYNEEFKVHKTVLSAERMVNAFNNYSVKHFADLKKETEKYEDLSVEYALSQVFSPKQKELFLKKVKGEPFTKTEREYFSRTVKKKVLALANPEVERLAKLVLNASS